MKFLALMLAAALQAHAGLPDPARPFIGRCEAAEASYYHARARVAEREAEARPLAEQVEALKGDKDPSAWTRFTLSRRLSALQKSLDGLRQARLEAEAARQELFLVLSALQEESRGAVERELARASASARGLGELLRFKDRWDAKLEELGFSSERPFPMQEGLESDSGRFSRQDRMKALEARAVQLEAWASLVSEDLRLFKRARARKALGEGEAGRKIARLENLLARIAQLSDENERLLSKN